MAFNEAILTDERPNFFELFAEEQLREALRPAFLYLTKVLARSRPELFSWLWRSRDEVHLMLDSALQWIFLTLNDSSFSEHFYGLERVQEGAGGTQRLSTKQMSVSFVCLVIVPYLKVKVERLHSVLTDENETLGMWAWQDCRTLTQLLKLLLFKSTPYLQSLWTLCHLVFRLNYLIRSSPYYSPLHWLAGVKLVHYQATDDDVTSRKVWSWASRQLLSLCLFSLRLLQWWYSGENEAAVRKMNSLPVPPPPLPTQPTPDGVPLLTDPFTCPLCHQTRRDPTTLATSGFVFCYDCIARHVESHGTCPLTLSPSSPHQLIRLFFS